MAVIGDGDEKEVMIEDNAYIGAGAIGEGQKGSDEVMIVITDGV